MFISQGKIEIKIYYLFINFFTRVYDTEKAVSIKKKNLTEKWAPIAGFFDAFTK